VILKTCYVFLEDFHLYHPFSKVLVNFLPSKFKRKRWIFLATHVSKDRLVNSHHDASFGQTLAIRVFDPMGQDESTIKNLLYFNSIHEGELISMAIQCQ
jgi:hypothetical protein